MKDNGNQRERQDKRKKHDDESTILKPLRKGALFSTHRI
jgi:hypothetical protein